MTGAAGLLGIMDALKGQELNYGLRFVFCGSEERGLLGSKAYVRDHEADLEKTVLNINIDMIGCILGKMISRVSAEDKLAHYITYMGAEVGFPIAARTGVYSSDSTPFADKGVPALSFARLAGGNAAPIHCRYDTMEVLSMDQLQKDIGFIAALVLCTLILAFGGVMTFLKQRKGLHSKNEENGIFILKQRITRI